MHSSIQVANKFLELGKSSNDMTPMKLLKLVYIAHGWMLGLYERRLISEDVEAWQYGPVIPELYREIKSYRDRPVESLNIQSQANFDEDELNIIRQVFDKYSKYDGFQLSNITHTKDTPWYRVWNEKNECKIIPPDLIRDYYYNLSRA